MNIFLLSFPIELSIGQFSMNLHLAFELMAFFVGYRYYQYLKKHRHDPISTTNRIWIFIGAAFGAFFFSRLLGGLELPKVFFSAKADWLYYYGNKTIVGALLGGLLCVEITKKLINEQHSSGDLMTFPLILGIIIGRIGCFSMGIYEETYGIETQLFTGMDLGDGLNRHPVSLYEIAFLSGLWFLLWKLKRQTPLIEGMQFQLFMIAYLAFRFSLDFIKPSYSHILNLSSIQWACLAGLMYYRNTIPRMRNFPLRL